MKTIKKNVIKVGIGIFLILFLGFLSLIYICSLAIYVHRRQIKKAYLDYKKNRKEMKELRKGYV